MSGPTILGAPSASVDRNTAELSDLLLLSVFSDASLDGRVGGTGEMREGWQLHQWPLSTESSLHPDEVVAGPVVMVLRAPAVSEGCQHIRPGNRNSYVMPRGKHLPYEWRQMTCSERWTFWPIDAFKCELWAPDFSLDIWRDQVYTGCTQKPCICKGYLLDMATVAPNSRYGVNWVGSLTPSLKHSWL